MTKEKALEKIEELKKYVNEVDTKKEVKIEIKNRWTGDILFSSTKETIREAVIEAVAKGANLEGADLKGADFYNTKFYGKGGTTKINKDQVDDFFEALGVIVVE